MTLFNKFWAPRCEHHTKYINKSLGEMEEFLNVTVAYNMISTVLQRSEVADYYKNISVSTSRILCFVFSAGCQLRNLPLNYLLYFSYK
jgi:hypothetical protein